MTQDLDLDALNAYDGYLLSRLYYKTSDQYAMSNQWWDAVSLFQTQKKIDPAIYHYNPELAADAKSFEVLIAQDISDRNKIKEHVLELLPPAKFKVVVDDYKKKKFVDSFILDKIIISAVYKQALKKGFTLP